MALFYVCLFLIKRKDLKFEISSYSCNIEHRWEMYTSENKFRLLMTFVDPRSPAILITPRAATF